MSALPSLDRHPFGSTPDGEPIELFTLANGNGLSVELLNYGGIVRRVLALGRDGSTANVALGFATLTEYLHRNSPHFGALIGRYANRIAGGAFVLDGVPYQLTRNEGMNSLHSGPLGFDKRVWQADVPAPTPTSVSVALTYTSPSGEMGFPGTLVARATHTLTSDGVLRIDYTAETDAPTVVNLTNHTYWNLAGEGSGAIDDHVLTLAASAYTPIDATLIPTGTIAPVEGTPLDFTRPATIGARVDENFRQLDLAGGYDFNYVLDAPDAAAPAHAATLLDPVSGRTLEVWTTEPGIQLYSGNHLDGTLAGTDGSSHVRRSGVALETQHFPDSPNRPEWPTTVLRPGELYRSSTEYRLSVTSPR
jgi:aldose 1-epimerase